MTMLVKDATGNVIEIATPDEVLAAITLLMDTLKGAVKSYDFTPSDTTDDPEGISRAVYCTSAGAATLLLAEDVTPREYLNLIPGQVYPFHVQRLNTGATAGLIGLQ